MSSVYLTILVSSFFYDLGFSFILLDCFHTCFRFLCNLDVLMFSVFRHVLSGGLSFQNVTCFAVQQLHTIIVFTVCTFMAGLFTYV